MMPLVQKVVREAYAIDPNEAARLATVDTIVAALAAASDADVSALVNAFMGFSPNVMHLLDSPEGVNIIATAMAALTGSSATYEPTSH